MKNNTTTIFVVTDLLGNPKDSKGNAYGYFLQNEEALCREYCKANNLGYQKKEVNR